MQTVATKNFLNISSTFQMSWQAAHEWKTCFICLEEFEFFIKSGHNIRVKESLYDSVCDAWLCDLHWSRLKPHCPWGFLGGWYWISVLHMWSKNGEKPCAFKTTQINLLTLLTPQRSWASRPFLEVFASKEKVVLSSSFFSGGLIGWNIVTVSKHIIGSDFCRVVLSPTRWQKELFPVNSCRCWHCMQLRNWTKWSTKVVVAVLNIYL